MAAIQFIMTFSVSDIGRSWCVNSFQLGNAAISVFFTCSLAVRLSLIGSPLLVDIFPLDFRAFVFNVLMVLRSFKG